MKTILDCWRVVKVHYSGGWTKDKNYWIAISLHFVAPIVVWMSFGLAVEDLLPSRFNSEPWNTPIGISIQIGAFLVIIMGLYRSGLLSKKAPNHVYTRLLFGFTLFGLVATLGILGVLALQEL